MSGASDDSEEAVPSDLEAEVGDMTTYRSLAEYRALTLGDEETAQKIRAGAYTEAELIEMLERDHEDMNEYVND